MKRYYISRGIISFALGGILYMISRSSLLGLFSMVLIFILFVYLPRSGRYTVNPQKGATPLSRDEWGQSISQRSGRNAWVIVTITGSGLVLYFGLISPGDVPTGLLGGLLILGFITYYISDYWMRKL